MTAHLRSEALLLIPPSNGPRLVQLSGGEGRQAMYDLSISGSSETEMLTPRTLHVQCLYGVLPGIDDSPTPQALSKASSLTGVPGGLPSRNLTAATYLTISLASMTVYKVFGCVRLTCHLLRIIEITLDDLFNHISLLPRSKLPSRRAQLH